MRPWVLTSLVFSHTQRWLPRGAICQHTKLMLETDTERRPPYVCPNTTNPSATTNVSSTDAQRATGRPPARGAALISPCHGPAPRPVKSYDFSVVAAAVVLGGVVVAFGRSGMIILRTE